MGHPNIVCILPPTSGQRRGTCFIIKLKNKINYPTLRQRTAEG